MRISEWMAESGVKFGTSGARGLVSRMDDRLCFVYATGFLKHLENLGEFGPGTKVALGGDLRPSTPRIVRACAAAVRRMGGEVLHCGAIPSPALACGAMARGVPSIMVTGSHIPADRNGIKFTRASGEIRKEDERGISALEVEVPDGLFSPEGALLSDEPDGFGAVPEAGWAHEIYAKRILEFLGGGALRGLRLGYYQHSAVGRDFLPELLRRMGAEVEPLARAEEFVPVDTEAISDRDRKLGREWGALGRYDAVLSTDGDSDRPLLADERGIWWRGDALGLTAARELGARAVALPASCTTGAELCGWFEILRTKIGSPYVIAGMEELAARAPEGASVVGFEANGGFLVQTEARRDGRVLPPLPTRDALLPMVLALSAASRRKIPLSALLAELPARAGASGLLREYPTERSAAAIERLRRATLPELTAEFAGIEGTEAVRVDDLDGVRIFFADGDTIHLRPSGNAPEFRCYTESGSEERAEELLAKTLAAMAEF